MREPWTPPGPGVSTATGVTSTDAIDLTSYEGGYCIIVATVDTYVRFGASDVEAAVTTDIMLEAKRPYRFHVPGTGTRSYMRAIAGSTSTIVHASASE